MNKEDCSCGGLNQSCRWCDGTGLVESKFDKNSLELMRRESRNKSARQLGSVKSGVYSERVISDVPMTPSSVKPAKPASLKKVFLFECEVCKARVENLPKHYAKHHSGRRVPNPSIDEAAKLLMNQGMCPYCSIKSLSEEQLIQHLKSVHLGACAEQASRKSTSDKSSTERVGSYGTSYERMDKDQASQLDGQHLVGKAFRDHGQFGSYPLHDPMDDESSA